MLMDSIHLLIVSPKMNAINIFNNLCQCDTIILYHPFFALLVVRSNLSSKHILNVIKAPVINRSAEQ